MDRRVVLWAGPIVALALVVATSPWWIPLLSPAGPPGMVTVVEGDRSGFGGEGCLVIREEADWIAFWEIHTAGSTPRGSPPDVDFGERMVLACFLGPQPNCCLARIAVTSLVTGEAAVYVEVYRNYTQGHAPSFNEPHHILHTEVQEKPVLFFDNRTLEPIPRVQTPG